MHLSFFFEYGPFILVVLFVFSILFVIPPFFVFSWFALEDVFKMRPAFAVATQCVLGVLTISFWVYFENIGNRSIKIDESYSLSVKGYKKLGLYKKEIKDVISSKTETIGDGSISVVKEVSERKEVVALVVDIECNKLDLDSCVDKVKLNLEAIATKESSKEFKIVQF